MDGFSYDELLLLSKCILNSIDRMYEAKKDLFGDDVISCVDLKISELRVLNDKLTKQAQSKQQNENVSSNPEKEQPVSEGKGNFPIGNAVGAGTMSQRTHGSLCRARVVMAKDLTYVTKEQLKRIEGIGEVALGEIESFCNANGIILGSNADNIPNFPVGECVICTRGRKMIGYTENEVPAGTKLIVLSRVDEESADSFKLPAYQCKPYGLENTDYAVFTLGELEYNKA